MQPRNKAYPIKIVRISFLTAVCFAALAMISCADTADRHLSPEYGRCYRQAFSAQPVNPAAPEDPSPAMTLPGEIASKMYHERYIPAMTEKKEKDAGDDTVSESID